TGPGDARHAGAAALDRRRLALRPAYRRVYTDPHAHLAIASPRRTPRIRSRAPAVGSARSECDHEGDDLARYEDHRVQLPPRPLRVVGRGTELETEAQPRADLGASGVQRHATTDA